MRTKVDPVTDRSFPPFMTLAWRKIGPMGRTGPGMTDKTRIDLLAVPESTGSLLYGLFDLFSMVRRDWSVLE